MDYRVRQLEVTPYHSGSFIIKNPRSARYEMVSEYQAQLLSGLEANGDILSLLFPASGVATSRHFDQCISLFQILRSLDLMERVGAEESTKSTQIFPHDIFRDISIFRQLQPAAESILEFCGSLFSKLGKFGILTLVVLSGIISILFLPGAGPKSIAFSGFGYPYVIITGYLSIAAGLCLRQVLRAAFLKSLQRQAQDTRFILFGPFLTLEMDARDIWMCGHSVRMQLSFVGIFAPMLQAMVVCLLHALGWLEAGTALLIAGSSIFATLLMAFPLIGYDGEEILHLFLFTKRLEKRIAEETRRAIAEFFREDLLRKRVVWNMVFTFIWALVWFDYSRTSFSLWMPLFARDLGAGSEFSQMAGAVFLILLGIAAILFPVLFVAALMVSRHLARKEELNEKDAAAFANSVSWQDKMRFLERIPLFSFLPDITRDALLQDMENHAYERGEFLVRQGDKGEDLYILVKGEALAVFRDATGKEHVVGTLREGDAFGEVALIDDVPRTASVIAHSRCFALSLNKEDFQHHIISEFPEVDRIKQMIRLSSFFKRHPLLSRLQARDQAAVIEKFRFRSVVANEEVLGQEGKESKFFLVYTGRLAVAADKEEEFFLGSEDCFGYLLPGQNPAYLPRVKAKEGSGLLTLSQEDFRLLIMEKVIENSEIIRC